MQIKRGILISLALYFATMVIGILLTLLTRVSLNSPQNIPTFYWVITIVMTVVLTSLAALWYFNKAKRSAAEGLKLGLTFIVVGFLLDLFFFLTQENGRQIIKEYYSTISFYIIIILVIATCVFIGSRRNYAEKEEVKLSKKKKR